MSSSRVPARGLALLLSAALVTGGLGGASATASSVEAPAPVQAAESATRSAQTVDSALQTEPAPEPDPEPIVATVPTMTGEFSVGSTLTADPGTWSPEVTTLTYQWVADGVDIPGATAQTFTLASAQAQQRIEVRVTGATADGRSASATSTTGFRVAIIGTPRISGTMAKGSTVSATVGTWTATSSSLGSVGTSST